MHSRFCRSLRSNAPFNAFSFAAIIQRRETAAKPIEQMKENHLVCHTFGQLYLKHRFYECKS